MDDTGGWKSEGSMPKSLFYAGVASCLLLAVLSLHGAADQLFTFKSVAAGFLVASTLRLTLFLLLVIASGALLVRMASLIAPRNFFAGFFSLFAIAAASFAVVIAAISSHPAITSPSEVRSALFHVAELFTAVAFLSLRPHFKLQANLIATLVIFPFAIESLYALDSLTAGLSSPSRDAALGLSTAAILAAIAVHCVGHRPLYIEVTNLRELFDSRIDPTAAGTQSSLRIKEGDVAFE